MLPITESFGYDYDGSEIVFGRGCIDRIGEKPTAAGFERAMVVCGSNVGANEALMGPLKDGLGDTLVGVFDGTTPDKTIEDVFGAIEAAEAFDPDVVVGVGGGSGLDIARQLGVFRADGRSFTLCNSRRGRVGDLAGLEPEGTYSQLSSSRRRSPAQTDLGRGSIEVVAATESPTGQPIRAKGSNMPAKLFYDPDLYETTPASAPGRLRDERVQQRNRDDIRP